MGRGYIRKPKASIQALQRISARREYVSMDRPGNLVARRTIDNVLGGGKQQLYEHFFKVELEADRLLFIPLVPTPQAGVDEN